MDKNRLDQFCPPGSASTAVRLAVPQDCASRGEGGALGNAVRGGEEAKELSNNHLIVTQPGSSPISFCHGCGTAQRPDLDSDRFCADCGAARPGPIGSISVQVQETSGCVALTSPGAAANNCGPIRTWAVGGARKAKVWEGVLGQSFPQTDNVGATRKHGARARDQKPSPTPPGPAHLIGTCYVEISRTKQPLLECFTNQARYSKPQVPHSTIMAFEITSGD